MSFTHSLTYSLSLSNLKVEFSLAAYRSGFCSSSLKKQLYDRMQLPIPSKVKKAWESWNIQVFILVSLFLQIILVFLAPFRKKTSNKFFNIMIWSAYMSSDWAATFVVGLVGNYNSGDDSPGSEDLRFDLLSFWAPFLLLHLSGPDTITAFALEDNELWLRILFGSVVQLLASAYILFLSLPKNKLLIPTVLMLLVGSARCAERVNALFHARLDNFREPLLPKTGGLGESSHSIVSEATNDGDDESRVQEDKKGDGPEMEIRVTVQATNDGDDESREQADAMSYLKVIQHAYRFFETFKGLVVDQTFSIRIRNKSREFFLDRTPEEAFNIVQAELDFFYGALYTKAPVIASKKGYLLRFVCISSLVASLVIFILLDKQPLRRVDVRITYTLLVGAMALDTISFLMLISSDWTTADLDRNNKSSSFLKRFYRVNKRSWFDHKKGSAKQILSQRWCESIPQVNLLRYVENQRSGNVLYRVSDYLGLAGDFLDEMQHVSTQPITDNTLKNLIFNELRRRAEMASDLASVDEIISSKYWLKDEFPYGDESMRQIFDKVEDFDETVLIWHMVTTLLFLSGHQTDDDKEYRQLAMALSDYMLYLLLMQPTLMFPVAGIAKKRFRDTCLHTHKLSLTKKLANYSVTRKETSSSRVNLHRFLQQCPKDAGSLEQGDKSVLFTVFSLAELLDGWFFIGGYKNKWERLSKIWVDLLFYAASRSKGYSHAQQLCNGGQLISQVWLLMTHLGLSQQFE